MIASLHSYSETYEIARERFRAAAGRLNCQVEQHPIKVAGCDDEELTIDTAVIGGDNPDWSVIVSSGLHGAEGFLGSAIQLAWMTEAAANGVDITNGNVVLIHGINPYGFKFLRRCNEHNIDLNRNFLDKADAYQGAPAGYTHLNAFLNPESPPPRYDFSYLQMLWHIMRSGLPALKQSIAGGQYVYPKGLFFGGHGLSASAKVIQHNIARWAATSSDLVHIDFHSALGRYGRYKLLLADQIEGAELEWYQHVFGAANVVPVAAKASDYTASGMMGSWIGRHLSKRNYRYLCAEFGTYSVMRVLKALRAENRAHFYGSPSSDVYQSAKQALLKCCCPADTAWRRTTLDQGLAIIEQAMRSFD